MAEKNPKNPFMKTISLASYEPDPESVNHSLWGSKDPPSNGLPIQDSELSRRVKKMDEKTKRG